MASERILIRGGQVVTENGVSVADVLVEGERIAAVGQGLDATSAAVFDASGCLVMPGGVDVHTHMGMPLGDIRTSDDFETGTIAAAFGGTTTVVDFANPVRGQSLVEAFETWRRWADGSVVIDYSLHVTVPEVRASTGDEMARLLDRGVTSFKVFMAYPDTLMLSDPELGAALRWAASSGALVMVHAEDGLAVSQLVNEAIRAGHTDPMWHVRTRPPDLEGKATAKVIAMAGEVGASLYVVHLTCRDALLEVARAKAMGQAVFAETCPHYLFLTEEHVARGGFEGAKYVCSPPLREASHGQALWGGLADGTLDVVATDHCAFNFVGQKDRGIEDFRRIPNGLPGVETRLFLLWQGVRDGRLAPERFVDLVSTAPARLFGLWPRKGEIAPGADADILVWDPDKETALSCSSLHTAVDYSPYEGMKVKGGVVRVYSRGHLVIDAGRFVGTRGHGRFLPRTRPVLPGRASVL